MNVYLGGASKWDVTIRTWDDWAFFLTLPYGILTLKEQWGHDSFTV